MQEGTKPAALTLPTNDLCVLRRLQGVTRLVLHPTQPLAFTGCLDGVVRCWDTRTGGCVHAWEGHRAGVQDLAVSPDGNFVLSGSEDNSARVFSML